MQRVKVIGVSLGSSSRDFSASIQLAGVKYDIYRFGTDGDLTKAVELINAYDRDRSVGAIGLGGVNLTYVLGKREYLIREGKFLKEAAQDVPIVDGAFVKQEWEPRLLRKLVETGVLKLKDKRVLLSSALDRFYLGQCLEELGARVWVGDALLALKVPILFPSMASFSWVGVPTMPFLARLPLRCLYPLGKHQLSRKHGWEKFFRPMDILAGDFHLLNRYLPDDLANKDLITSTLTEEDRVELGKRGAGSIFPLGLTIAERSFGANILDALLTAAASKGVYGTREKSKVLSIVFDDYWKTWLKSL